MGQSAGLEIDRTMDLTYVVSTKKEVGNGEEKCTEPEAHQWKFLQILQLICEIKSIEVFSKGCISFYYDFELKEKFLNYR